MSNDRNAGGLESPLKRFDRHFFCRSFHSKLFPVGGPPEQNRRVAPIVLPASLETFISTRRARRHFGSLPSRPAALRHRTRCRGSNQIRSHRPMGGGSRNPVFTRLCRELSEAVSTRDSDKAPAVLDRMEIHRLDASKCPCSFSLVKTMAFVPCQQSMRNDRRGMNSYWFDFRKTNTDAPATASTPGRDCLTVRERLAKGILGSQSIFRARYGPNR